MISLLKSNNTSNYLVILLLIIILWAEFFFKIFYVSVHSLYTVFPKTIFDDKNYLYLLLSIIFYFSFSYFIIQRNINLGIIESSYQTIGIFFILFSALFTNEKIISLFTMLPAMFLYFSVFRLFNAYKNDNAEKIIFDTGILFAITLIFNIQYLLFIIPLIISIIIIKQISFKELLALFLSIISVLALFFSIYFFFDTNLLIEKYYSDFFDKLKEIFSINFSDAKKFQAKEVFNFMLIALLILVILILNFRIRKVFNVFNGKVKNIMFIFLIFSVLIQIIPAIDKEMIVLTYCPLAFFSTKIFVKMKNKYSAIFLSSIILYVILIQILTIYIYNGF